MTPMAKRGIGWVGALAAVAWMGCAHDEGYRPAASANADPFDYGEASATEAGIEVQADTAAWGGVPQNLDTVIPVEVEIENDSNRPLMVSMRQFSMVNQEGKTYSALPPLKIEGVEWTTARAVTRNPGVTQVNPRFTYTGVTFPRPYATFYGTSPVWTGPFSWDTAYYDTYYGRWPVELPTTDMIARALPDSVVGEDGEVKGYVYFERPEVLDDRLRFRFELVDANTNERFGVVEIPFVRRNR